MRKRRQDKKHHKFWLQEMMIDVSQNPQWRKTLFYAEYNETFTIDKDHLEGISDLTTKAIRRFGLRYRVAKVQPEEAEAWLCEGGQIIFKFWCADYSAIRSYSGNNPERI